MKTVLLTGATGYIGQFAVKSLLERGFIVHTVTSKSRNEKTTENLVRHQTNLLDPVETGKLIKNVRPSHLLHFAWYVEHQKFWNAAENIDWLQASLHLARQFAVSGGNRMVISGTCAEYDWAKPSPLSEFASPFRPQTLYGTAKYSLALALEKFAQVSGFSFASGKIFFPFGANESPNRLIPSVVRALLENRPAETSHGNQIRDFLYVEDVVEAFAALLESDVEGAVNIGSGRRTSLKEIIVTIGEIIGKPELLQIGAIAAGKDDPAEIIADVQRLRSEVKFEKDFDLREKLRETVAYWKRVYEINN